MTFKAWDRRASRLTDALLGLGAAPGNRVAVFAFNCLEWLEIYAATVRAGLIAVPVNFRLAAAEMRLILEECDA